MIHLEPNMRLSDIEQWVGAGVFLSPHADGLVPAEVEYWPDDCEDEDSLMIRKYPSGKHTQERVDLACADSQIFPHWPLCGAVNLLHHKCAVYYERLQMKQWRRTFNWRQIRLVVPCRWELNKRIKFWDLTGSAAIREIFSPKYPSIGEVCGWFEEGWHTVAINQHTIITNTRPRMVYHCGVLAATLEYDGGYDAVDQHLTARLRKMYPEGISV